MRAAIAFVVLTAGSAVAQPMPGPAHEIADLAKLVTGAWKCSGSIGDRKLPVVGTMTSKLELGGSWIHESMALTAGDPKTGMTVTLEGFNTYSAASKTWRRLAVDSIGNHYVGTAPATADHKFEWTMEVTQPAGPSVLQRVHTDMSNPGKGVAIAVDESTDHGKTWIPGLSATCTRN
jgi:hypothetical protein